ncbi:MAG: hypothetical protein ACXWW9_05525 [Actinomycetota bacterium]
MPRRVFILVLLVLAVVPAGVPVLAAATSTAGADLVTLEARIERAQGRVNRWYERIERWYQRIDRAAVRVERLETIAERRSATDTTPVVSRTTPRAQQPAFLLAVARRDLRATLTDPWARRVQAELDTWSAYLAELVHARERALRPAPADDDPPQDRGTGLEPGQTVTYEGWAVAFLGHLDAPSCGENLLIVVTWETAESTSAAFNPLATTRDMPGASDMNTVGVKHYVSLRQGLDASRDTLLLGAESYGYGAIVESLRRCASAEVTARAINASAWCRGCVGGAYITGLLPIVRDSYSEHAARSVSTAA